MFYIPEIIIINACGATVLVGEGERLIMDVADVKAISGYAKSAKIIASHMDTVSHLTVTREDIKNLNLDNVTLDGKISGSGFNINTSGNTNINGTVGGNVNNTGTLTSKVDNLTGNIDNSRSFNASGSLDKTITGDGTTFVNSSLTLNNGAKIDGALNLNNGSVTVSNGSITSHNIGTLAGSGNLSLDINSGASAIDSFILNNTSSGTINITALNDIGTKPTAEGNYTFDVISGSGVTLNLADSIKTSSEWYQAETTSHGEHTADTIEADTDWNHIYYDRWTDTHTGKSLNVSGNSLVFKVIDHQSQEKQSLGDTLSLVNKADLSNRTFKTDDETKTYELSSELGTTAAGNFFITGATDGTNTSTVDLNNKNGFNLNNATNLTLTDVKLTGANGDTVTLNNENASLKLNENAIIDGSINNISGSVDNKGSITGNVKNSGNFTNDGTITGTGTLTNSGNLINNGTISSNSITNEAGGTITSKTQDLISVSPIENNGTLNLTGASTFSNISGVASGKVNINADSSTFTLDHNIQGNELTFNGDILKFGTNGNLANVSQFNFNANAIDLVNNSISNTNLGNLNLLSDMNLMLDGNFAQRTLDTISVTGFKPNGNHINISNINIMEPTTATSFSISPIGEGVSPSVRSSLASAIRYTGGELVYSPIYRYSAVYDPKNGMLNFTNLNNDSKFNPAVLVAPVVTQSAGQVTMWQTFNTAFEHADTYMPYPKALRISRQNANMYAISTDYNNNIDVVSEIGYEHTNLAGWAKPYTTFESINLAHGPKLNIISYGTMLGGDSDFRKLKNGWSNVGTLYIGYNGSQIDYDDVDVTTNGGTIGITETFYKNNFFTAITAAAGASVAQAHTMYGKEDLTTLMSGIASKTGYNFEFLDGKFIIQPTMHLNYSMIKTFDYTNAAGVRVNSDPAHTIQINPNIRFIGNFKGGWQPYASVGMVWNLMNRSHTVVNGIELPQMHARAYVEYGVGLQKQIGENFSGYGQVMLRNGGRNGVTLTAGFRWYIGRKKDKDTNLEKNVGNKTVIKKSKSTNKK